MSTQQIPPPTFNIRAGSRELVQIDYGPRLPSGDYLVGRPTVVAARLRGYTTAGALTIDDIALESGDQPERISFMAAPTLPNVEYRLDTTATTQNGARIIIPVILKSFV